MLSSVDIIFMGMFAPLALALALSLILLTTSLLLVVMSAINARNPVRPLHPITPGREEKEESPGAWDGNFYASPQYGFGLEALPGFTLADVTYRDRYRSSQSGSETLDIAVALVMFRSGDEAPLPDVIGIFTVLSSGNGHNIDRFLQRRGHRKSTRALSQVRTARLGGISLRRIDMAVRLNNGALYYTAEIAGQSRGRIVTFQASSTSFERMGQMVNMLDCAATFDRHVIALHARRAHETHSDNVSTIVQLDENVTRQMLLHHVRPRYPAMARVARVQGRVVLQVLITCTGDVDAVDLVSGHPMLAAAAVDAVKQWRYQPYVINGQSFRVRTPVILSFCLDRPEKDCAHSVI